MTLKRIKPDDFSETFVLLFPRVETLKEGYTQTTLAVKQELSNDLSGSPNTIQHLLRASDAINTFKIFYLTFTIVEMLEPPPLSILRFL